MHGLSRKYHHKVSDPPLSSQAIDRRSKLGPRLIMSTAKLQNVLCRKGLAQSYQRT